VLTHKKIKKYRLKKTFLLSKLVAECEVLKGQKMGSIRKKYEYLASTTIADNSECQKNLTKGSSPISEDVTKENIIPGAGYHSQDMIPENIKTLSSGATSEDVTKQNATSGTIAPTQDAIIQFIMAHSEATFEYMTKKNIVITAIGTLSQNVIYQDITT